MLVREFISETNKNQMISTLLKHYSVGNVRINYKSLKRHADYDVDRGVLNLSTKYKIIKPSKIYLGEKDMQQLKIIEEYIKKNEIKTKVISCNTIREKNGLAYSSRNFLLSSKDKKNASNIYKLLIKKKRNLIKKKIFIKEIKNKILKLGISKIDYIKILDINKLIRPYKKIKKYKIFIAYYLGSTRLIDNV